MRDVQSAVLLRNWSGGYARSGRRRFRVNGPEPTESAVEARLRRCVRVCAVAVC